MFEGPETKPMRLGLALNLLRDIEGLSLRAMCDFLQEFSHHFTPTTLHCYENGSRFPSLESSPELLNVVDSLLRATLGGKGIGITSVMQDMSTYFKRMLGKEALLR